jgi:hypothetical protein
MDRREVLVAVGAGLAVGTAGCLDATDTPTTTPAPSESTLRIRVENETDATQEVTFQLDVTSPGPDTAFVFGFRNVEPGTTRTSERELDAGRYELEVTFPLGGTTVRWTGNECAETLVVIRFTDSGVVVSDRCPGSE